MSEGDGRRLILGRWGLWLAMVAVVTILAGLLFGYDQGVISGALVGIKAQFDLSTTQVEVVTAWVTLGALVGALVAGGLADRFGRKTAGILAGALFALGALIQATAPGFPILVVGRFIIGFGVGVASVAAPLYAAEQAPTESRGRFVSTYQLAITIGILLAYLVNAALVAHAPEGGAAHGSDTPWRLMLGIAMIPGILLVVAMGTVPRSSHWLMKVGRRDEARAAYVKVRGTEGVDAKLRSIAHELQEDAQITSEATWKTLLESEFRRALWVGLGLALFQQITGINAVIYYADQIFDAAGFKSPTGEADATLLAVGVVNVLATFVAIAFIDRLGRRPLLFAGLTGMIVSLTALGFAFLALDSTDTHRGTSTLGVITLVCLVVFIASFAFSLGPIVWTIINEIYPNRIRGRAVAVTTALNWGAAFVVSQFFLTMIDWIGQSGAFFVFAGCSVAGVVFIWFKVPETKGLPLERVKDLWKADDPVHQAREWLDERPAHDTGGP